jgi:hypothetical protein
MPCGPKRERCPTNVVGSAGHVHIDMTCRRQRMKGRTQLPWRSGGAAGKRGLKA